MAETSQVPSGVRPVWPVRKVVPVGRHDHGKHEPKKKDDENELNGPDADNEATDPTPEREDGTDGSFDAYA